jgi:hypothetical protein
VKFVAALFHADDPTADSLVLGALVLIVVLCLFEGWSVIVQGRDFSAFSFASAGGVILGALGTGKRVRDGAPPPA